jgi:hypothetical protein
MFGATMHMTQLQLQSVQHKLAQLRIDIQTVSAAVLVDSCIAAQAVGAIRSNGIATRGPRPTRLAATKIAGRVA